MIETVLTIERTEKLTPSVFQMTLTGKTPIFLAGQFLHVEVPGYTLRRPFCITAAHDDSVTIIFATVGAGTLTLSQLPIGTKLNCILPIGNGFPISDSEKRVLILGGGLGAAPLLPILAQNPDKEYTVLLGFGTAAQAVETDEFRELCGDVRIATDDGSLGYNGRVTELAAKVLSEKVFDVAYVCGPTPMLRAAQALTWNCPVYVSMEARMGCGVGACLVCTCAVQKGEIFANRRVCIDGPVFSLADVKL